MHIPHTSDYSSQELQLRGTMVMTWYDFRLSWNPDEYDDLDYIELSLTEIWRPELIVYERLSKHSDESFQTETDIVKVHYTGKVDWVTIASTRTFCSINVENFPKDKHTCDVTFTTWLHRDNEQKLQILGKMDSCEIEHLTWRLTFTGLGGNDSLYRCHQYLKNQSYVRYIATLERLDTQFGMFTLVAPNTLISVLSLSTICFPRGDNTGPTFGMMCLLALIIQLGTLYQVLPDTAFSKVGQSIAILTIFVAIETIISVINMGIEDVSNCASKLKNWFKRVKRGGYEQIPESANPQEPASDGAMALEKQRPNPTTQSAEGGSNRQRREGDETIHDSANSQGANSGGDTVSNTKTPIHDNGSLEDNPSFSSSPAPVKVEDGSTESQNVKQMQRWFKFKTVVAIFFFLLTGVINVRMFLWLNN